MRNFYLCVMAALLLPNFLFAQDIVVKCNGEEIKTKIVEIGDSQIKYRKYETPQGPAYTIPASEVFVIRFEDGTKEVITPLDTPSQSTAAPTDNTKYAQINQVVTKTKEPIRDKLFFWGPRIEMGYASLSGVVGLSGPVYSAGVIAEYMFGKASINGVGMGVSYDMYTLQTHCKLNYINIDWYYVIRPRSQWNLFLGFKMGIPTKSEVQGVDLMANTTLGAEIGAGWATKHFDLGAAFFGDFSNAFKSADKNKFMGVKLRVSYRF